MNITLTKEKQSRSIDPNVLQRLASTPEDSVWVGASAGSGKTKVLTDRILRLLLPRKNGAMGVKPHKILALTFTKAAASEMALRIANRLSEWATMPLEGQKGLTQNLKNLLGHAPTELQLDMARKLFASVIDSPGGLQIMTIHSFCQSVLGRFPLEADLPPNFKALEETQAKVYLERAIKNTIQKASNEKSSGLSEALNHLSFLNNQEQLVELLNSLISERRQMKLLLKKYFDANGLYQSLCQNFGIAPHTTSEDLKNDFYGFDNHEDKLRYACKLMAEGTPSTDQKNGLAIQLYLDIEKTEKSKFFEDYKSVFLTQKNEIKKTIITKKIQEKDDSLLSLLHSEAQRLIELEENIQKANTARLTRDLFIVGSAVLDDYNAQKNKENLLDFDDLILRTLELLKGETKNLNGLDASPWIRYKMDQGIDHILVDEAQDTNPEQWEIIQSLCDDFFDGQGQSEDEKSRSIFIVGDEKQSIFSFQRASPEKFHRMREWFSEKIQNTNNVLQKINFETSFRSTPAILDYVDQVFNSVDKREGLSDLPIKHYSHRYKQAGHVELWPLFENDAQDDHDPWTPPVEIVHTASGASKLAEHIGDTIQGWIDNKEILESHNRPIEPGDIMILVKSRTGFLDQIVRSLKSRHIPVNGVDRMILNDQLVIQDLCALIKFSLLPEDDLNLATILKSPLIGWDEGQLFKYSYKRQSSLWANIKASTDLKLEIEWLETLIEIAGKLKPYDFLSFILNTNCPADEISGLRAIKKRLGEEALDPLNEFLNKALQHELENTPDLQNFLQDQLFDDSQIKRQMEEANKAVRIMTVHGAKGLEAPIVILPDTTRTSRGNKPERIFWPDKTGQDYPYYCPISDDMPQACEEAKEILQQREDEEYRRLFYVALTRAEDRLYIGGYQSKRPIIDQSWYRYAEKAFDQIEDVHTRKNNDLVIKSFSNPALDKADRDAEVSETMSQEFEVPDWLFSPLPEEETPPRPLMPSRPSDDKEQALSPLQAIQDNRFKRGNITHKLLQILPDIAPENWEKKAKLYLSQPAHDLSKNVQEEILTEVLKILQHEKFAPIFGEGSIAEAPITGLLKDNRLVSGQIDRLLITETVIYIIDYKSNRPSPENKKDVPQIYKNQMQSYADVMREIYPDRDIRAALLWTDKCQLMEIDIA
jgi:ATP-dependent helicase/nuclease subunit A